MHFRADPLRRLRRGTRREGRRQRIASLPFLASQLSHWRSPRQPYPRQSQIDLNRPPPSPSSSSLPCSFRSLSFFFLLARPRLRGRLFSPLLSSCSNTAPFRITYSSSRAKASSAPRMRGRAEQLRAGRSKDCSGVQSFPPRMKLQCTQLLSCIWSIACRELSQLLTVGPRRRANFENWRKGSRAQVQALLLVPHLQS